MEIKGCRLHRTPAATTPAQLSIPSDWGPRVTGQTLHVLPLHVHFLLLRSRATQVLGGVSQPEALRQVAQVEQSDVEDVLQRPGVGGVGPDEGLQGCKENGGGVGGCEGGSRAAHTPAKGCPGQGPCQATASSTTYMAPSICTCVPFNSSETNRTPQ